ncbi:DUF3592 domain-containing protein [Pseudomonas sp. HK3]
MPYKCSLGNQPSAELNSAEVNSYQSRNDDGSYTTMYSVDMEYEYWSDGRSYTGNRVDISENNSSDSDKHYQRLHQLKQEAKRDQFKVWVNPNDLSESVYDRAVDIKLTLIMALFSSTFMLVGGGIIQVSRKKETPLPSGIKSDPSKPWTTRAEWASKTLYSNAESKLGLIKFFTILATLFLGVFALALFGQHPVATAFSFIFCIPPVLMFRWYRKTKREWDHFDKVPLHLKPYPGVIGGTVGGDISVPCAYTPNDQYTFELKCTHHWTTRSGKETRSHSSTIWSKVIKPTPRASSNATRLTFEFDVPSDKPSSSAPDNDYHSWTLDISSQLKGINFNREYEIPVFVTRDSKTIEDELTQQPLTTQQKADIHSRLSVNQNKNPLDHSSMTASTKPTENSSLSFHTPGSKAGWFIGGIGLLFFIIGVVIANTAESFFGFVFAAMATVFIALGILALGRNCHVRVQPNQLEVDVFIFSKMINQHRFTSQEVEDIKPRKSSSTSQNGKTVNEKYSLMLTTKKGKSIDLGGEFASMKNATHMKLEIESILNAIK